MPEWLADSAGLCFRAACVVVKVFVSCVAVGVEPFSVRAALSELFDGVCGLFSCFASIVRCHECARLMVVVL